MRGGSVGARIIAAIATNNYFELSRYRAAKLMIKLKLESCQVPQHSYKRGGNEHLEIPTCLIDSLDFPAFTKHRLIILKYKAEVNFRFVSLYCYISEANFRF